MRDFPEHGLFKFIKDNLTAFVFYLYALVLWQLPLRTTKASVALSGFNGLAGGAHRLLAGLWNMVCDLIGKFNDKVDISALGSWHYSQSIWSFHQCDLQSGQIIAHNETSTKLQTISVVLLLSLIKFWISSLWLRLHSRRVRLMHDAALQMDSLFETCKMQTLHSFEKYSLLCVY